MRSDMQACTRGRRKPGRSWLRDEQLYDKFNHTSVECIDGEYELADKVRKEGRPRGYRERAIVRTAPLYRYLESRKGKDWDQTYSEIRANLDFSEISWWLGSNFAKRCVEMPGHCYWEDGRILHANGNNTYWLHTWYVDPETNFLQKIDPSQRPPRWQPQKAKPPGWHVLDKKRNLYLVRHVTTGIWYRLQLLERPKDIWGGPITKWFRKVFYYVHPNFRGRTSDRAGIYFAEDISSPKSIHAFVDTFSLFARADTRWYRQPRQASKEEVDSAFRHSRPKRVRDRPDHVRNSRSRRPSRF